jgi:hypothetical protein
MHIPCPRHCPKPSGGVLIFAAGLVVVIAALATWFLVVITPDAIQVLPYVIIPAGLATMIMTAALIREMIRIAAAGRRYSRRRAAQRAGLPTSRTRARPPAWEVESEPAATIPAARHAASVAPRAPLALPPARPVPWWEVGAGAGNAVRARLRRSRQP